MVWPILMVLVAGSTDWTACVCVSPGAACRQLRYQTYSSDRHRSTYKLPLTVIWCSSELMRLGFPTRPYIGGKKGREENKQATPPSNSAVFGNGYYNNKRAK